MKLAAKKPSPPTIINKKTDTMLKTFTNTYEHTNKQKYSKAEGKDKYTLKIMLNQTQNQAAQPTEFTN